MSDDYSGFDVSLQGIRSLPGMLERLPHGSDAKNLAERLGVWTTPLHAAARDSRTTPTKWSDMSDANLSDANGYWNSEVHRATELQGLITGQLDAATIMAKANRAAARSRARKNYEQREKEALERGEKLPKLAATQVNDLAEEDPAVIASEQQLALMAIIVSSVRAYKEASIAMTAGLSREISFRQAQMAARVRY